MLISLSLSPASTVSSQILLTHLFLLLANLPGLFGWMTFFLTLILLPLLFCRLRFYILPTCPHITYATDLRLAKRETPDLYGTFIQTLQLQSSKVTVLSMVLTFL